MVHCPPVLKGQAIAIGNEGGNLVFLEIILDKECPKLFTKKIQFSISSDICKICDSFCNLPELLRVKQSYQSQIIRLTCWFDSLKYVDFSDLTIRNFD